jgi:hypothetical protein
MVEAPPVGDTAVVALRLPRTGETGDCTFSVSIVVGAGTEGCAHLVSYDFAISIDENHL